MSDSNVNVRLSANVAQYVTSMQAAAAATTNVTKSGVDLNKLGSQFQSAGRAMTLGLTAPIVAAGVASVGMSNKFNTSFTRMTTLAGVSTSEIGKLRESVLKLSGATGRGPQELADALYAASSSGLDAAQSMKAVEIAAKGAAAGLGSSEDIISLVASATASYGSEMMSAAKATDILVGTIREGRADPDELAGSLGRVLPTAAALGVTFEEVGGTVAFLSNVFGDTNRTVTAVSGVFNKLQSPTDAAREALAKYGSSMETLHGIIDEDGVLGAMRHLQEIGLGDDPLAFRAVFDDIEARQGAQAMIDNLDALEGAIDGVSSSAGSLDEAFKAAQGEDGFKMAQAWAEIQIALIEFGDAVGPVAADVAGAVAQVASAFASLPSGVQTAIAAVLLAVGPMAMIAGKMMTHAKTIAAARQLMSGGPMIGPTLPRAAPTLGGAVMGGAAFATLGLVADGMLRGDSSMLADDNIFGQDGWRVMNPTNARVNTTLNPLSEDFWITQRLFGGTAFDPEAVAALPAQSAAASASRATTTNAGSERAASRASSGRPGRSSGPPSLDAPIGFDDTYDRTAPAEIAAAIREASAAAQEFAIITASTDWGAAGFVGAQAAMSAYTSEFFSLANIAMASEQAYDNLNASLDENGMTFDLATEKGRANQQALQALAATIDNQFVSAYDNAGGSLETFMASADAIGMQTIARLSEELGISTEAAAELATQMGLTATDYEARFNLAGDEEAKIRLGLLSGTIGLLQEDVQREVAMQIATGDFQGALDTVQANIEETPRSRSVTVSVVDNATATINNIQTAVNSLTGKSITVTTTFKTAGDPSTASKAFTTGSGWSAVTRSSEGRFVAGGTNLLSTLGEVDGRAGDEVVLPLGNAVRMRALLSDSRVLTPVMGALGGMGVMPSSGGGGSSSSMGGSSVSVSTGPVYANDARGIRRELERMAWAAGAVPR